MAGMVIGAGILLSACGGGSGGNGNTSVSGTAASGRALTSGSVELSCKDGLKKTGIAISATGTWGTTVPTANLPCVVKASDGTSTYYAFTVGNGSSIVTNVTPLTTLTLAQILGAVPSAVFASLSATDLSKLNETVINAAIAALKTALDSYALPGQFNPVTSPLTASTGSQTGNDYDRLLDQFKAANPDLDALVSTAATGTVPTLATPSYTPAATGFNEFFTAFAGDYTLTVDQSGAEGSNNAAARALFPLSSRRTVHIKSNGDVSIDAEGRTLSYLAATYSAVTDRFTAGATNNTVRYRAGSTIDLYITYDATNGKLQVDAQGFVNTEGYASLKGVVLAPSSTPSVTPSTPPTLTSFTPTAGVVGDTVTVTGSGFSTTLANNVVRFTGSTGTGIQAAVVSGSATQLVVTVPAGAQTGPLTVYNGEAVATVSNSFTVNP